MPEFEAKAKARASGLRSRTIVRSTPAKKLELAEFSQLATVGVGCFAKVRLARWKDHPCVLKVVDKGLAARLRQGPNLLWERKLLSCVDCPFVVKW